MVEQNRIFINLKKSYEKEYGPNSLIINLKNFPEVDYITIYFDGKSHARFIRTDCYDFGANNHRVDNIFCLKSFYRYDCRNVYILTKDPEIQRVYTKISRDISGYNCRILRKNPKVITNLYDTIGTLPFDMVNMIGTEYNSLSKIFNLSNKQLKLCPKYSYRTVRELKNLNFSCEEIIKYQKVYNSMYDCILNRKTIEYAYNLDIESFSCYRDYLRMRNRFSEERKKDYPNCPENLTKWHDRIIKDYNNYLDQQFLERNEKLQSEYLKVLPIVEKYAFSGDDYIIVPCKNILELVHEGRTLSHCVASYCESVSQGKEYILFLRNKENPDIPFYTIDITPDNVIRQIHGKCNCNVTEKIAEFIKSWANKFNLDASNYSGIKCHL